MPLARDSAVRFDSCSWCMRSTLSQSRTKEIGDVARREMGGVSEAKGEVCRKDCVRVKAERVKSVPYTICDFGSVLFFFQGLWGEHW